MSNKPLTKKEWQSSVAEMWGSAVEATYRDLIDAAVKAEREACAKVCANWSDYTNGIAPTLAEAIRARGQA